MAGEVNEELKKCGFCKKSVNRAKRYYRNGRYYCNMNCWNQAKAEAAEEAAEAAAKVPAE